MAAGEALLVTSPTTPLIAAAAGSPGDERALRRCASRTALIVPLRARGRVSAR